MTLKHRSDNPICHVCGNPANFVRDIPFSDAADNILGYVPQYSCCQYYFVVVPPIGESSDNVMWMDGFASKKLRIK